MPNILNIKKSIDYNIQYNIILKYFILKFENL